MRIALIISGPIMGDTEANTEV